MATVALTAATKFTANDRITGAVKKMQAATTQFTKKTSAGLAAIARQERKVRQGFQKLTGKLGQLGLAFGALAIISTVAKANIELDASLASLQAITGVTNKEFVAFSQQVGNVAKAQREFAGDTAKAFEIVASAQPILLKNADALARVTNASITLSKASGDDLATAAGNLTSVMNQFNLAANQSERVMNALAAGSVYGSANITNVALSMKNFGAVAAASNVSVEQAVALVEVLGSKAIFAEEAGTNLRSSLLKLQAAGLGYASGVFNINDALTELKKKTESFDSALKRDLYLQKVFGVRQITTGQILLQNIDKFNELTSQVTGTNTAVDQMNIKANTLANRFKEVKNAFLNQLTTTDATNKSMQNFKDVLDKVAGNMDKIIAFTFKAVKAFLIYKGVILAVRTAMILYNITTGIMGAVTGIAAITIGQSKTAMLAYQIAVKAVTAAQWLWNAALMANPIGLIIVAVVAAIAVIVVIIRKWNEWGAAVSILMGPLGTVISMIQSFRRNWEMLKAAFKSGGILGALKAIGKIMIDSILMPVQQLLKLISKIPGIGDRVAPAVSRIQVWRENLGVNTTTDEDGRPLNADAELERIRTERIERNSTNNVRIGVEALPGTKASILDSPVIPVELANTLGWSQ